MKPLHHTFLFWLLLITLLKGFVWAFLVPIWHFPDEQAHFAQISYFVETGKMPPVPGNDLSQEILISERLLGTERDWAGNNKFTYHPEYNVEYTDSLMGKYESEIAQLPIEFRKNMVKKESADYPPLYYYVASLAYRLVYNADLFTRVLAVRIWNLIFFIFLIVVSYLFFKRLFPQNHLWAATATTLVAFHPMLTFVAAGINSDNLFNLLFTWVIFQSLVLLDTKITIWQAGIMAVSFFLAIKTKPQGVLALYVYFFPIVWQFFRGWLDRRLIPVFLAGAVFIARDKIINLYQGNQVIPNVGTKNLKLPNLTFIDHLQWTVNHTIREVIPWYWGVFKWLSLVLPRTVNRIINRIMILSAVGLVVQVVWLIRKKLFSHLLKLSFLFYVAGGYFLAITIYDFLFTRFAGFSIGVQGRYFFPTIVVHMGLLMLGLIKLAPKRLADLVAKILGFGMVLLNIIAFYTVAQSYYDVFNWKLFFIQASQYKPWFAKSPYLQFWFFLYGVILACFLYSYLRLTQDVKKN